MNKEQLELIRKLEELGEVIIVKKFDDPKEAFANYFSKLDIHGIGSLLNENNYYDEVSKENYLNLIQLQFESLKSKGIHSLKLISGGCNFCKNGCSGFTFLDEINGFYMDLIIEVKNSEIVNFMECMDFKNEFEITAKKEQIVIKPFIKIDKTDDLSPSF